MRNRRLLPWEKERLKLGEYATSIAFRKAGVILCLPMMNPQRRKNTQSMFGYTLPHYHVIDNLLASEERLSDVCVICWPRCVPSEDISIVKKLYPAFIPESCG